MKTSLSKTNHRFFRFSVGDISQYGVTGADALIVG